MVALDGRRTGSRLGRARGSHGEKGAADADPACGSWAHNSTSGWKAGIFQVTVVGTLCRDNSKWQLSLNGPQGGAGSPGGLENEARLSLWNRTLPLFFSLENCRMTCGFYNLHR